MPEKFPKSSSLATGNPNRNQTREVLVIGAGFSGIGAAIRLKGAGISFLVLEKANDIGGAWRDNHYPGIAVDITSFTYSFSFYQNPRWSRIFAPGAELQKYAHDCVNEFGVSEDFRFGCQVDRATFDQDSNQWTVECSDGRRFYSRYLIAATGALTQPKIPSFPGREKFQGRQLHTARWQDDLELEGKRVAVVGTGATSVQLVPSIAARVKRLTIFQRTPIWIFPKPDAEIPPVLRELFAALPLAQQGVRTVTTALTELVMVAGIVYNRQTPWLIRAIEELCLWNMRHQIRDPELREKLTPKYGFGCKRPSFSSDYYPAFNRPNVDLVTDPITEITPEGVRTSEPRDYPADILLWATGFQVFEKGNTPPFEVYGPPPEKGAPAPELGQYWEDHRYQAYEGTCVQGFPNFFLIYGPYAATGSSWFSMIEAQCNIILRLLKEARQRGSGRVEVTAPAHEAYHRDILKRQQSTVFFNNDCSGANSYYFDRHGDAPFLRPASGLEMWWRSQNFPLTDFHFS